MGAVEFLEAFAVLFREFDYEFEVGTVEARRGINLPGAASENAFEERCFVMQKRLSTYRQRASVG